MKISIVFSIIIAIADASFVIQKMNTEPKTQLQKWRSSGGRSLINSVDSARSSKSRKSGGYKNSRASRSTRKSSKSSKSGKSRKSDWASINIVSSIGSPSQTSGKKYKAGKSAWAAPSNSGQMSFSYIEGLNHQKRSNNRKSRRNGSSVSSVSSSKSRTTSKSSRSSKSSPKSSSSSSKKTLKSTRSIKNVIIDNFVYVTLPLNQWTEFFFAEVGQLPYSRWIFDTPSTEKCVLQVVDSFCTGDRFQATRFIESTNTEIPLLSTPPVPFNPVIAEQIRSGANVTCTPFTTEAEIAWASSAWSKGQVALESGSNYKLILKSLLAPYGSGGAFVRVSCQNYHPAPVPPPNKNVCTYGSGTIKYIRQALTFTQQAPVCQSYGFRPLDVTNANIREAREVLMHCAGVDTRAWISSYNGDNYRGVVGLSMHATKSPDAGSISATPDLSAQEGVLCQ